MHAFLLFPIRATCPVHYIRRIHTAHLSVSQGRQPCTELLYVTHSNMCVCVCWSRNVSSIAAPYTNTAHEHSTRTRTQHTNTNTAHEHEHSTRTRTQHTTVCDFRIIFRINSDRSHVQHLQMFCVTEQQCVYCEVGNDVSVLSVCIPHQHSFFSSVTAIPPTPPTHLSTHA
jgi:hypothetical protein